MRTSVSFMKSATDEGFHLFIIDAYSHSDERSKKKKKKKGSSRSIASESINSREMNFPEDAEGGLYGDRRAANPAEDRRTSDTDLNHQF